MGSIPGWPVHLQWNYYSWPKFRVTPNSWPTGQEWVPYRPGQSIYNGYNSLTGQSMKDGFNTRLAGPFTYNGIITHYPNLGLHLMAGQLVKNGFHTSLASPFTMELLPIR